MILDRHWWRTADGRLVPDGDPDAAILAYPHGHEIPDHLAEKVGLAAAVKQAAQPANKMAARPADKAEASAQDIREWAAASGYEVAPRGKLPAEVVEAYRAAHEA